MSEASPDVEGPAHLEPDAAGYTKSCVFSAQGSDSNLQGRSPRAHQKLTSRESHPLVRLGRVSDSETRGQPAWPLDRGALASEPSCPLMHPAKALVLLGATRLARDRSGSKLGDAGSTSAFIVALNE